MTLGYIFLVLFALATTILPFLPRRIMAWYITNVIGKLLFLEGTIEGRDKYYTFKNTQTKGIVVFNHSLWLDMLPVCHVLGEMCRGTIKSKYLIGPLKILAQRLNMLLVEEDKTGMSATITKAVSTRCKGEDLICLAPAGTTNCYTQDEVPEFRKGAFWSLPPVLPVIIYYSIDEMWDKQTLFQIILARINGDKMYYHAQVMEPIFPLPFEKVETYVERVRECVRQGIMECKHKARPPISNPLQEIKNFCLDLLCLVLISSFEENLSLAIAYFFLITVRCLHPTPQCKLLADIWQLLLFCKFILACIYLVCMGQ